MYQSGGLSCVETGLVRSPREWAARRNALKKLKCDNPNLEGMKGEYNESHIN